jgi:hypothetical protein
MKRSAEVARVTGTQNLNITSEGGMSVVGGDQKRGSSIRLQAPARTEAPASPDHEPLPLGVRHAWGFTQDNRSRLLSPPGVLLSRVRLTEWHPLQYPTSVLRYPPVFHSWRSHYRCLQYLPCRLLSILSTSTYRQWPIISGRSHQAFRRTTFRRLQPCSLSNGHHSVDLLLRYLWETCLIRLRCSHISAACRYNVRWVRLRYRDEHLRLLKEAGIIP